jgi:hypothetical protein
MLVTGQSQGSGQSRRLRLCNDGEGRWPTVAHSSSELEGLEGWCICYRVLKKERSQNAERGGRYE